MTEDNHSDLSGLVTALRALGIETGSLACLGCAESDGHCSIRGCAIIRRAVRTLIEQREKIRELEKQNDRGADTEPRREERKDTHEQH